VKLIKNKISVLLSTYNDESTIQESIQSILNQTYDNFELLINIDGSSDSTKKKISEFSDKRIIVFNSEKNRGLTKSLNFLTEHSTGEYIARQDADDASIENRFEYQINEFKSNKKLDFVTSRAVVKNSNYLIPKYRHLLPHRFAINFFNPFIHGTLMIKKLSFETIGRYDENFKYAQDYKLFKDALHKGCKFKTISKPLYILNTTNNISSKHKDEQKYYSDCVKQNKLPMLKN